MEYQSKTQKKLVCLPLLHARCAGLANVINARRSFLNRRSPGRVITPDRAAAARLRDAYASLLLAAAMASLSCFFFATRRGADAVATPRRLDTTLGKQVAPDFCLAAAPVGHVFSTDLLGLLCFYR